MPLRCSIEVSAFVSVMIALLSIFMAHMPDVPGPPLYRPVDLAKTSHSILMKGSRREDALIVSVTRDNQIYFELSRVGSKDLTARIKDRVKAGAPSTVYLNVDARAHYRAVALAIDCLHEAGVEQVGLLTEPRHGSEEGILSPSR